MDRLQSLVLSFLYAVILAGSLVAAISVAGASSVFADTGSGYKPTIAPAYCSAAPMCAGTCEPVGPYQFDNCNVNAAGDACICS
jgi:hypothetical protein